MGTARRCGCLTTIPPSKVMRTGSRPAWPIWRATSPMRSKPVTTRSCSASSCGSAFALARGIGSLAASTINTKRRKLEAALDEILAAPVTCDLARDIQTRMRRARDQVLTFASFPGRVEATNNACERDLRPAVIQRKNTNGYRAMWSAQGEAAVRTVVATARLKAGPSTFGTVLSMITA